MIGGGGATETERAAPARSSPIHRVAPEAKLVGLVAFASVVALTPRDRVPALLVDATVVIVVAALARLRPRAVLARLTVITPFLLFALSVPFVAAGPDVEVGGIDLSVEGLWAAWNVVAKATIGAGASIVVATTTSVTAAITGLTRLRLPPVLVAIAAFMFRYLDLVAEELARTRRAMTARGHDPRWLWQARPLAAATGALFIRSFERGERVHQAMLARGYRGTLPDFGDDLAPGTAGDPGSTDHRPMGRSRYRWVAALAPATVAALAAMVTA